ncbi:hypothetical protein V2O64_07705 [Verrucomicrobiaceae bacterium 227]
MKPQFTKYAGAAIAAFTLISATPEAAAQRRPGPAPGGGSTAQVQVPKLQGELKELGKAGDRFTAWRVANIDGAEWFTKTQEELREQYREVEKKIREAVAEDRLNEKTARQYLVMLLQIGEGSKTGEDATETAIANLDAEVQSATVDNAKAETLTPRLNQLQWQISEILLYGSKTSALSKGKMASLTRKLLSNEEKEVSSKEDGEISERELEKLEEDAMEIWADLVKELRGRND